MMLSKAITWLKDWFGSFSFGKYPARANQAEMVDWDAVVIFEPSPRFKALKLADIARKRTRLKEQLEQAKRQKKARKWIYRELEALTREELRVEAGK